jgi:hypothetical protein
LDIKHWFVFANSKWRIASSVETESLFAGHYSAPFSAPNTLRPPAR